MRQLALHDINLAHALLEPLAARHLAVHAVRHGQRPGSLWVDTLPSPCIVLVGCDLGWYLGGTPGPATDLIALGGLIPSTAYLIHDGPHWLAQFPLFLHNQVARPHPRIVLRRTLVPAEPYPAPVPYRTVPLDADDTALDASDRHALDRWLENDRGTDVDTALAGNIGHALFDGKQLLALCLTELVANERAELGVWVMPEKRRQGLGRQVVQHRGRLAQPCQQPAIAGACPALWLSALCTLRRPQCAAAG
ncbi:hypothetical protein [Chitinolyticbacter meiyuanensis]|uniref:hypothetical protein n=1 Tax=Chitinolyticbacter meiyuanensis TaxID=682798 RepID=UPI0011E60329|nr:hypothetical protein [Chitinolyticbacter meiyuanensis]